ncbi:MAG: hypothetical protein CM15mP74_04150 [Halieaceae bacterium]|nr:MAG: hypothetical protein CM15mP74_04150 [Halieaceae bacterium]
MAVQIVAYELRMVQLGEATNIAEDAQWDTPFATAEDMDRFYEHLERTLIDIEFLKPEAPRQLMRRLNASTTGLGSTKWSSIFSAVF